MLGALGVRSVVSWFCAVFFWGFVGGVCGLSLIRPTIHWISQSCGTAHGKAADSPARPDRQSFAYQPTTRNMGKKDRKKKQQAAKSAARQDSSGGSGGSEQQEQPRLPYALSPYFPLLLVVTAHTYPYHIAAAAKRRAARTGSPTPPCP